MHRSPKLSVVVPAYNERATIEEVLSRVQAVKLSKEVIVVDDGSTDGTREFLRALVDSTQLELKSMMKNALSRLDDHQNIRVLFQDRNYGKGAALRRGFQESSGEIVIIQDADLELDPEEYHKLIDPIDRGVADVVYGSRFLGRGRQNQPTLYYAGNQLLTLTSNVLTGLKLTDVWTGYKVFRREILQGIRLRENRFGFEAEITAKVAKSGCRVAEVPVSYACRSREEGKKIGLKDSFRGMWCTLRYSLLPD